MTTIVDDGLVLRLVLGGDGGGGPLATTYAWWWRLGSAIRRGRGGELSRPALALSEMERAALIDTVDALPSRIDVPDPRALYPLASMLGAEHGLNLLAAEALAAAVALEADILVSVDNPRLRRAAAERHVVMRSA